MNAIYRAERRTRPESGLATSPDSDVQLCHDLRQHVAASQRLSDSLADSSALDSRARALVEGIAEELANIAEILTDQMQRGRATVEYVDLGALVASCCRTTTRAHGALIDLAVHGSPRVKGNAGELRRAISNLLDNAWRAAPDEVISVSVRATGRDCVVDVVDQGPGFGRIKRGTGLGLSQVRLAVSNHSGSLNVSTTSGGSTRLRVIFPQARSFLS